MITKAFVISKAEDSNKYFVRIPLFEVSGRAREASKNASVIEATLCYQGGVYDTLMPNDCVFVEFENNQFHKPVIIGKLYLGREDSANTYELVNSLKVTDKAELPLDTKIGDFRLDELKNLSDVLHNHDTDIHALLYAISQGGGGGGGSGPFVDDKTTSIAFDSTLSTKINEVSRHYNITISNIQELERTINFNATLVSSVNNVNTYNGTYTSTDMIVFFTLVLDNISLNMTCTYNMFKLI